MLSLLLLIKLADECWGLLILNYAPLSSSKISSSVDDAFIKYVQRHPNVPTSVICPCFCRQRFLKLA